MSNIDFQSQISNRYLSIDFLKGFIILLMTFVNTMAYFDLTPTWTRHADVYGLTYVDLIAPCFIFLLVINFHLSYEKRIKYDSKIKVFRHFIIRNLILLALGLILYIDVSGSQLQLRWGTLQYIASTGFIILLCVRLPKTIRLIIGIIGMFIYQIFLLPPYRVIIYNSIEGGIIGIISWASIGLLSSFLATGLIKNTHKDVKLYFLYFGLIILFFGILSSFFWGISRFLITMPFDLISVGISSIGFYVAYFFFEQWEQRKKFSFLNSENFISILGKNSLMLFLLHLVLINILFVLFPKTLPLIFVFILGFSTTITIWLLGYLFYKSGMIFKL